MFTVDLKETRPNRKETLFSNILFNYNEMSLCKSQLALPEMTADKKEHECY